MKAYEVELKTGIAIGQSDNCIPPKINIDSTSILASKSLSAEKLSSSVLIV